jgi:hypothetical protein
MSIENQSTLAAIHQFGRFYLTIFPKCPVSQIDHIIIDTNVAKHLAALVDGHQSVEAKDEEKTSCLILDDFSELLRNKAVLGRLQKLIYKHRHYRLNILISVLTLKSLPRQIRGLIDVYILFRPKSVVSIRDFVDDVLGMTRAEAQQMFNYVFDKPYNFLFFNQQTHTFYKNFNKLVIKME